MKQLLRFSFLLLALLLPATATAHDFVVDGIYYKIINATEVSVTNRNGYSNAYSGDVTIPPKVTYNDTTYTVTSIRLLAFSSCTGLTSVTIPNTVINIDELAFSGCSALTSIDIPSSVTHIGPNAFKNCIALDTLNFNAVNCAGFTNYSSIHPFINLNISTINIGDSVQRIPEYFVYRLTTLTRLTIGKSVTNIGNNAFSGCTGIKQLTWNAINCSYKGSLPTSDIEQAIIGNEVQVLPDEFVRDSKITEVTIPNSVTTIGYGAFGDCSGLTSIAIPNSVTTIGEGAFYNCSNLTRVDITDLAAWCRINFNYYEGSNPLFYAHHLYLNDSEIMNLEIPNTVTAIGNFTFSGCSALISVTIPNSVNSIDGGAFSECSGLTSVTIGSSVSEIGFYAFKGCSGLTHITIPNSVTFIGSSAFRDCSGLTSIAIPNSVTSIEWGAFWGCSGLISVTIPNSITSIDDYVFFGCTGLTNVIIPDSVTAIGSYAFSDCSGLTSVIIPDSVTAIGSYAFSDCSGLTSVTIPNSVTSIGSYAFSDCSGLTSVTIPNSVTSIGSYAFQGCTKIETLNFNAVNCNDFDSRQAYQPFYYTSISTINIGDSVQRLPAYFVNGLTSLAYLTIGKSVTYFGNYAFSGCTGIKQLAWNAINCSSNGNMSTSNIEQVIIGDGVQTIPGKFVYNSKITEVAIPNSVTAIGHDAFYNCSNLTRVNITDLAAWCNIWFDGYTANPIYYAHSLYLNNNEVINLEIPDTVTSINDYAFYSCSGLMADLTIPNSVTNIGYNAFSGCTGIKQLTWNAINCSSNGNLPTSNIIQVTIGDQVTVLPDKFACDSKITEVAIPNSVTTIGNSAFSGCYGLIGELIIPNSVSTIANSAFYGCSGLTGELIIPNSVSSIGNLAFSGCSALTSLTIPRSVTYIGNSAFSGCTEINTLNYNATNCADFTNYYSYHPFYNLNISTINIGDNVQRIPAYFAYGLQKLSSVTIPTSVTSVGTQAFYNCPIIESVTCLPTTPPSTPSTGDMALFNTNVYIHSPLYVPMGTEKSYMYDQGWGQFINIIGIKTQDEVLATDIALNQSVMSMILGTSSQLVATVLPDSTTNKAVSWASSDPNVATIDENGVVTAMGLGNAMITAITTDGSNLSAMCRVIVTSVSATNGFVVADIEVMYGNEIVIPVAMTNDQTILAFQTDIFLPEGFSIVIDENHEYLITPSSRLTDDHILMANENDGVVSVVCYTPEGRSIGGNSGDDLFYITVQVPEDASGDYAIYLRTSRLTTGDSTELRIPDTGAVLKVMSYIPGDANDSRTVTVTDIVVAAQYVLQMNPEPFIFEAADMNGDGEVTVTDIMLIAYLINHPTMNEPKRMPALEGVNDSMSGEDVTLMADETRNVSIQLNNEMDYTAFQLDLTLPAGLIASNFQLTDRAGSHALDVNTLNNSKTRVLCYSPAIEAIEGHEGALLTFDVTATDNVEGSIMVDGIEMVTANCQTVLMNAFAIGVNSATSVNELNGAKTVARVDYYNLAGQQIDRPESGVTLVVTTYTDGTRTTTKVIK